jgi:hypothetical protein
MNKGIFFFLGLAGISRRMILMYAGEAKDVKIDEARESFDGFYL